MKGDEDSAIQTQANVHLLESKNAWMNENVFIKWIRFMFPFVARDTILLVFDSARSHISKKVKAYLHTRGILFAVIPGGLTGLLQPCDVSWFKPLKASIANEIDRWKANGGRGLTPAGNPRPPTIDDMVHWLSSSWSQIRTEMLDDSFRHCFLGDTIFLHIARHEVYGPLFLAKVTSLLATVESGDIDEVGESDPGEIDDE